MSDPDHFVIANEAHPDLVLDIESGSNKGGAKLIVWKHHGGANQQFKFADGFIKSCASGLVVDVEGGTKQGSNIIQWEKHGGPNQRWRFHKDGSIRCEGTDLCIDINGGSSEPGTKLIAWPFHGGANQKWRVVNRYQ